MFDDVDRTQELNLNAEESFELLRELERNTPEEIRKQRTHFRIPIKTNIVLQPGNSSQLLEFKVKGVTGDISESGLGAVFPIPIQVGDIYRLSFEQSQIDLPMMFARCMRCSMIREGHFNCGFKFFTNITLPESFVAEAEANTRAML